MHVMLFQMTLLPLTMCRFLLTQLSLTPLKRVLPVNEMLGAHAYIGFVTVALSLLVTSSYLIYYGVICQREGTGLDDDHDDMEVREGTNYCRKVTAEIFLTGVAMMVLLLLIGGVSIAKEMVSYEFFRMTHNLALGLYGLAVLHTFDFQVWRSLQLLVCLSVIVPVSILFPSRSVCVAS